MDTTITCKKCKGTGERRKGETCAICQGSGQVIVARDKDGKIVSITPAKKEPRQQA